MISCGQCCFLLTLCQSLLYLSGAEKCQTLDGQWYNQLGSLMVLTHTPDGLLVGEYRTQVERETGSSGNSHSKIIGAAPYNKPGASFGFAVMFNGGSSTATWTGQCLMCDGREILLTSWLLRELVDSCQDKWKAVRIGQDSFTRDEQDTDGNKVDCSVLGCNCAFHFYSLGRCTSGGNQSQSGSDQCLGISAMSESKHKRQVKGSPFSTMGCMKCALKKALAKPSTKENKSQPRCKLDGYWYNDLGSEIILRHTSDNVINGEYRTAVEKQKGSAGTTHSKIYGLSNFTNPNSTFALFVVWRGGASVTAWIGQCHICGVKRTQVLDTTWLLRSRVNSCHENWKSTLHGQNGFTRHVQKQGPRKKLGTHTPGQDGEDLGNNVPYELACSTSASSAFLLSLSVLAVGVLFNFFHTISR